MKSSNLNMAERYGQSIFLNEKYNPAILWVNSENGTVIYSQTMLLQIDMEDMRNEGLLDYLPDRQDLLRFLTENFCDYFKDLKDREEGIPPTILFDVDDKLRLAA